MPAITARVRYSKASTIAGKNTIIALLDIETATFVADKITLQKIDMRLLGGITKNLGHGLSPLLPMTCKPRDCTTFLFRLTPDDNPLDDTSIASNSKSLDVSIDGIVLSSDTCLPQIEMQWRTAVDFSTALNLNSGAPKQPLQRGEGNAPRKEQETPVTGLGSSITFTAPTEVYVGEPFNLDVFAVNQSSKPRKLAILVVPKRKRAEIKTHFSRVSASSTGGRKDAGIADAVTDENLLYATQRNATRDGLQIISLSNDTIIG